MTSVEDEACRVRDYIRKNCLGRLSCGAQTRRRSAYISNFARILLELEQMFEFYESHYDHEFDGDLDHMQEMADALDAETWIVVDKAWRVVREFEKY